MGIIKWTKEKCAEEAIKYNTRSEFKNKCSNAYNIARIKGWIDDICGHMIPQINPPNYWTKERCAEEALKYNTRDEFNKNSCSAYNKACKNEWLDDICLHMTSPYKPKSYWTKEKCQEESKKFKNQTDFRRKSKNAYKVSSENDWLKDFYLYRKSNGYWTKERCAEEALKYKSRGEFKKMSKTAYALSCEKKWLNDICSHMDYIISPIGYWNDKEKCRIEALKYDNKTDFIKKSESAYKYALKNDWIDEICSHMIFEFEEKQQHTIYVFEFEDKYVYIGLSYHIKNRYVQHMSEKQNERKIKLKETVSPVYLHKKETKLEPIFEILKDNLSMYDAKYYEKYYIEKYKKDGYNLLNRSCGGVTGNCNIMWTYDKCKEESLKYSSRSEFNKKSRSAFSASYNNGWLNDFFPPFIN